MGMKLIPIIIVLFLIPALALAQEESKEVCFVYFTANCDNCRIADSYIENVKSGYSKVVVIQYSIDDPSVNWDVLMQYKDTYEVEFNRPMVLFGMYDALRGMDDIRIGLQLRVDYLFTQDGNPCPLVDGSTIPSDDINEASLPGEPEIFEILYDDTPETPQEKDDEIPEDLPVTFMPDEIIKDVEEYVSDPKNRNEVFIIAAFVAFIALAGVIAIMKYKKK